MPRPTAPALIQITSLSFATILGSGMLDLPVALAHSGQRPFYVVFFFTLFAQLGIVHFTAALLQHATVGIPAALPGQGPEEPLIDRHEPQARFALPNLVTLSHHYLGDLGGARWIFNILILGHFTFIMYSYASSASQIFQAVLPAVKGTSAQVYMAVFTFCLVAIILKYSDVMVLALSVAALVKFYFLNILIWIVFIEGLLVDMKPTSQWSFNVLMRPLLVGTIAMSGVVSIMPVSWEICVKSLGMPQKQAIDRDFMLYFCIAIDGAIVTCFVLNILWCIGVLGIVPQSSVKSFSMAREALLQIPTGATSTEKPSAGSVLTLSDADNNGMISTIPLAAILNSHFDAAPVVMTLYEIVISFSALVSFLIMGMSAMPMLHAVRRQAADSFRRWRPVRYFGDIIPRERLSRFAVEGGFIIVLLFLVIIDSPLVLRYTEAIISFLISIEAGLVIGYAFLASRHANIPHGEQQFPAPKIPILAWVSAPYFVIYFFTNVINALLLTKNSHNLAMRRIS